jgi:N-acetylglucosaminyldiphosphoundecaprenol N-acetyl-beta-D-mannosaminyltransferase
VVTASQDVEFGRVVREADMATPDGAPVAWMMRKLGYAGQQRINGPDLMWKYCELVSGLDSRLRGNDETMDSRLHADNGIRDSHLHGNDSGVFLFGSTEDTLLILKEKLLASFPGLKIAGAISPPFRTLTTDEDDAHVAQINASGAGIVWVSLGCPKQELWMAAHRGRINAVMVGVGAAFDYHAGTIIRAPKWMQDNGLEWLHRLASEPGRLWKRYLVTNTLFILGAMKQLAVQQVKGTRDKGQGTRDKK